MFDLQRLIKDLGLTQAQFADRIGKSDTAVNRVIKGKIALPKDWIARVKDEFGVDVGAYISNGSPIPIINHDPDGKEVPFYEVEVFATISPAMGDVVALRPDTFIKIPMFSQGQFAVQVTGHSMKPYISNADWVIIRKITDRSEVIYGEPYLIVTKADNLKTVKFLKEGSTPDTYWLVPYNVEQFEPQEIKRSSVLEMYRVIGVFKAV